MGNNFKYSAFIRKNTPELREKLRELGYRQEGYIMGDEKLIFTFITGGYVCLPDNGCAFEKIVTCIECGENEEAFIAIAAIRTDTDKGKWFILTKNHHMLNDDKWLYKKGEMFLMKYDYNYPVGGCIILWNGILGQPFNQEEFNTKFREATPQEIIKYFSR